MITLKQNYEFRRAYKRGRSFSAGTFVLYVVKGRKGKVRLGITVSKKIGKAVERNRAKRVIRAAFRGCLAEIRPGCDLVIVARAAILSAKSTAVEKELRRVLRKADLWMDDAHDEKAFDRSDPAVSKNNISAENPLL